MDNWTNKWMERWISRGPGLAVSLSLPFLDVPSLSLKVDIVYKLIVHSNVVVPNTQKSQQVFAAIKVGISRLAVTGRNESVYHIDCCPTVENSKITMTQEVIRHQCTVHGLALKVTCLNNERTRGHFVTFARFARSVTFWVPTLNCKQYLNRLKIFWFEGSEIVLGLEQLLIHQRKPVSLYFLHKVCFDW